MRNLDMFPGLNTSQWSVSVWVKFNMSIASQKERIVLHKAGSLRLQLTSSDITSWKYRVPLNWPQCCTYLCRSTHSPHFSRLADMQSRVHDICGYLSIHRLQLLQQRHNLLEPHRMHLQHHPRVRHEQRHSCRLRSRCVYPLARSNARTHTHARTRAHDTVPHTPN